METFSKKFSTCKYSSFPATVGDITLTLWESSSALRSLDQKLRAFLESIHNPAFAFDKLLHCYSNSPLT